MTSRRAQAGLLAVSMQLALARSAMAEPVLHEYLPPPAALSASTGEELPSRPPLTLQRSADERVLGASGARLDRVSPDRSTTAEGVLRYRAEFNPDVVPFKRMSALDTVGANYTLHVGRAQLRPVPVTQVRPAPDRELFWGSLVLQLEPHRPVPIPSVAPEARILSYFTTPRVQLAFLRDAADNFSVQAAHQGVVRLVFLTDAPRRYFTPEIPPAVTVQDVPTGLQPVLPAEIRRAAERVLQHVDISPRTPLLQQLDRLTGYFRNFDAGRLPRLTGDTYLDIALSRTGVCRHRSLAFVVTAQALGIPARYVQNEAHAFVEVFVPRMGWARIDLGGAAARVEVVGAEQSAVHRPPPDPFPRPSRYAAGNSGLAQARSGIRAAGNARSGGRSRRLAPVTSPVAAPAAPGTSDAGDAAPPSPRAPTEIAVYSPTRTVLRGQTLTVRGRILGPGGGAGGLPIEIHLSRGGEATDVLLGTTVSGGDGRFVGSFAVPVSVRAGDYEIRAVSPGNDRYQGATSR